MTPSPTPTPNPAPTPNQTRTRTAGSRRPVAAALFGLYTAGVVLVTVFPIREHPHHRAPWWVVVQVVPFHVPLWSFALNVLMFAPFGVLVPLLWPATRPAARLTALALASSAAIELTQFVLWITVGNYRTVDINDLIANTAGGVLGLVLLNTVRRSAPRDQDAAQARM